MAAGLFTKRERFKKRPVFGPGDEFAFVPDGRDLGDPVGFAVFFVLASVDGDEPTKRTKELQLGQRFSVFRIHENLYAFALEAIYKVLICFEVFLANVDIGKSFHQGRPIFGEMHRLGDLFFALKLKGDFIQGPFGDNACYGYWRGGQHPKNVLNFGPSGIGTNIVHAKLVTGFGRARTRV